MKLKYKNLFAIILLLFFISSCGSKSTAPKPANKMREATVLSVEGFLVHPSVLNASIEVAGTLLPFEETEIHPEVAGKVIRLSIKEGAIVKKGTF